MPGVQCNGREGTQRNTGAEKARQDWEGSHWKAARSPQEKHLEPTQKRKARAWMHLIFQNCSEKIQLCISQGRTQPVGFTDTYSTKHWGLSARPPAGRSQALLCRLMIRLLPPDSGWKQRSKGAPALGIFPLSPHPTVQRQTSELSEEDRLPGGVGWNALIKQEATKPSYQPSSQLVLILA